MGWGGMWWDGMRTWHPSPTPIPTHPPKVAFARNAAGTVIFGRRFNHLPLLPSSHPATPLSQKVAFVRNAAGKVIFDRRFNVAAMMAQYYPGSNIDFAGRIQWDPNDPNILQV